MNRQALLDESPKIFRTLARFLNPNQLATVASDYEWARHYGGNIELGITREEGVSYNPRLARLLSIVTSDLGVTELLIIRATLYAAVAEYGVSTRLTLDEGRWGEQRTAREALSLPREIEEVITAVSEPTKEDATAVFIRGVIALDTVRHLHQTSWELATRESILEDVERSIVETLTTVELEILFRKLRHAVSLQRRRLEVDRLRG
jgi:hypothetical protein